MEVEFRNVTITITANSPEEAYDELCGLFAIKIDDSGGLEYTTDTFVTDVEPNNERPTHVLFPANK